MTKKTILLLISALLIMQVSLAGIENAEVKILGEQDYSNIWLGVSTGGYKLIAEKGTSHTFRVFIKNGMPDTSLHNLKISPDNLSFQVNSIVPKSFEQIKPMEIVTCWVNITIPQDTQEGKYVLGFDVLSDEFPKGVFRLDSELQVVKRIKTEVYVIYTIIIVGILGVFAYRKISMNKK